MGSNKGALALMIFSSTRSIAGLTKACPNSWTAMVRKDKLLSKPSFSCLISSTSFGWLVLANIFHIVF